MICFFDLALFGNVEYDRKSENIIHNTLNLNDLNNHELVF